MLTTVCQRWVGRCARFVRPSTFEARRYEVADVRGWWISAAPMSTARVSGVRPRAPVPLATPHRAARAARGGRR